MTKTRKKVVEEQIYNMLEHDGENAKEMMKEYTLDELMEAYQIFR